MPAQRCTVTVPSRQKPPPLSLSMVLKHPSHSPLLWVSLHGARTVKQGQGSDLPTCENAEDLHPSCRRDCVSFKTRLTQITRKRKWNELRNVSKLLVPHDSGSSLSSSSWLSLTWLDHRYVLIMSSGMSNGFTRVCNLFLHTHTHSPFAGVAQDVCVLIAWTITTTSSPKCLTSSLCFF